MKALTNSSSISFSKNIFNSAHNSDSMQNTYVFLRHAKVRKETSEPSDKWILSDEGIKYVEQVAATGIFDDVNVIISSSQKKVIQTAYFLANRLDKDIITNPSLDEIDKGSLLIEDPEEYQKQVVNIFDKPDESIAGWESANQALKRFQLGIDRIEKEHSHKKILIVTHGIVLTLYFASILKETTEEIISRWKRLKSCAWGIVENKKIIHDIVD